MAKHDPMYWQFVQDNQGAICTHPYIPPYAIPNMQEVKWSSYDETLTIVSEKSLSCEQGHLERGRQRVTDPHPPSLPYTLSPSPLTHIPLAAAQFH